MDRLWKYITQMCESFAFLATGITIIEVIGQAQNYTFLTGIMTILPFVILSFHKLIMGMIEYKKGQK